MLLPAVELRGLTKHFREGDSERTVLRDVNATLWLGEIAVFVGRSGSGKSTLLNLISGIDRPSTGSVLVNGTDLTTLDERARTLFRREHIGFVFQFFNLIPTLTVEENLLLPLELKRRIAPADRARAYPDRLSGGEQQRVAVARALVHDPALVLADEPTGNLDAETAKVVVELLDQLVRELGKTVVMATHSAEVVGNADRVFLVQHGQLAEQREGTGR